MLKTAKQTASGGSEFHKQLSKVPFPAAYKFTNNWDIAAKTINAWMDRLEIAARTPDRREKAILVSLLFDDLHRLANRLKSHDEVEAAFLDREASRETSSVKVGEVLSVVLIPRLDQAIAAIDRIELSREMGQVAFALAAYRADHGQYPDKLELLTPKYLGTVPDDVFKQFPGPIGYQREGEAYRLWTVHHNGIDELGRSNDDVPPGDDYVLRPVRREKK